MRSHAMGGQTTIIKRSARKKYESGHSGAWKVAFADFTLAMMALFMVLWIVGVVSEEERQEIVAQINGQTIFAQQSFISIPSKSKSGGGKFSDSIDGQEQAKETKSNLAVEVPEPEQSLEDVVDKSRQEMEELSRIIMQITSAYDAQSNLHMEVVPQGLRILIQDDKQRDMFQRSSAVLTPFFSRLLGELAPAFNEMGNKIIITGHTDASRYRDQVRYNNWNLSGERALMAHKALVNGGLDEGRVLQINAMADQMLLNTTEPLAAKNRRIEIMVLTKTASDTLYQFFGNHGENVVKSAMNKAG
ncbi:putative lateral flagellar export/assembly protein LafU [Yersinia alsatica]|uniref:putative lateral flagellar export/assembly protein LafU n=1 Tax=Yersinia alsatica TaxID=2890317 RepID=UPI0011AAB7A2|nr:putative lateral flagellar export/assembly protein LafU [Yersinia alsatica]